MIDILKRFREYIQPSISSGPHQVKDPERREIDDRIALGALMWFVAQSDDKFLPEEQEQIKETLKQHLKLSDEEVECVVIISTEVAKESIDLFAFTHRLNQDMSREQKKKVIAQLFRVACSDGDLAASEEAMIRKISDLLGLEHNEYIEMKITVKKDFGMDTVV